MKVLVIGIDGASPLLIEKWIENLPTFKKFKERGCWGKSIPPIPAQTPVAWTTFMTGKNPGKHGIFSFAMRNLGTYERKIINPEMLRSQTLWSILSKNHKRVGVINVPMASLEKINGFMVPGFLSKNEGRVYPQQVKRKLEAKLGKMDKVAGDLETAVLKIVKQDPNLFFRRVNEVTDELGEVSLYLLEEEEWDFFMVVFMGTDRIQHFFWKYVDEGHPEYEESEYCVKVKEFYKKIDKIIGSFLDTAPKDTLTILLSDHGFCPIKRELLINKYLKEQGILKIKDGKVDLEKSRAVSYGYGDIWLNVKGREPKGTINREGYAEATKDIIKILEQLTIDGEKPIKRVMKREEIYWGPFTHNAPDLMALFKTGWQASRHLGIEKAIGSEKGFVVKSIMWSGGHDGAHDPEDVPGLLAILGSGVEKQDIKANLYDIAPTILSIFRIPVPLEMDGLPLPFAVKE